MGSVKLETRNDGRGQREWDYVTLSEPHVVAKLIQERGKLDPCFYPSLSAPSIDSTSGVFQFSEPIFCVYIDLDKQIDITDLSENERFVVDHMMLGYTYSDQCAEFGKTRQTYGIYFTRAVEKICEKNNEHWRKTYEKK